MIAQVTRRVLLAAAVLVGLASGLAACDKPTPDECRKALVNMQELLGTENTSNSPTELEQDVRQCTGGSTKKSVACAAKAQTKEQLMACDFYKGYKPAAGSGAGSGAGSAGSAK